MSAWSSHPLHMPRMPSFPLCLPPLLRCFFVFLKLVQPEQFQRNIQPPRSTGRVSSVQQTLPRRETSEEWSVLEQIKSLGIAPLNHNPVFFLREDCVTSWTIGRGWRRTDGSWTRSEPVQICQPPPIVLSSDELLCVEQEVKDLLAKGTIVSVPQIDVGTKCSVSNLFLVPKKDGGQRPVVNLKKMDSSVEEHFKMEGIHTLKDLLTQGDWMCNVDLKDAYFLILIAEQMAFFLDNKIGKLAKHCCYRDGAFWNSIGEIWRACTVLTYLTVMSPCVTSLTSGSTAYGAHFFCATQKRHAVSSISNQLRYNLQQLCRISSTYSLKIQVQKFGPYYFPAEQWTSANALLLTSQDFPKHQFTFPHAQWVSSHLHSRTWTTMPKDMTLAGNKHACNMSCWQWAIETSKNINMISTTSTNKTRPWKFLTWLLFFLIFF